MYSLHSIIEEDLDSEHSNYARQSMDMNTKPRRMRSAMALQPTAGPSQSSSSTSSRSRAYTSNDLVYESGPSLLRFPAPPTSVPAPSAKTPSGSSSSRHSSDRLQSQPTRPKAPPRSLTLPSAQAPVHASSSSSPTLVNPPLRTSSSMTCLSRPNQPSQLKSCFEDDDDCDDDDDNSSSGSESRYKSLFKRAASALKSPKHQPQGGFASRQHQSMHVPNTHSHKSVSVKDVQVLLPSLTPTTPHASSSFTFPRTTSPGKEKPLPSVPPFHHGSSKAGDLSPTPSLTSASSCSSSSSSGPVAYIRTSTIVPTQSPVSPEEVFDYVDTLSGYFSPSPLTGAFPESQMENPKAPWTHSRADSHDLDRHAAPIHRSQHHHTRSGSLSSIASSTGSSFVQTHSRVSSTTSLEDRDAKPMSDRRPGLKSYASSSALNDDEAARKRVAQRSLLPPSPSPYKRPSTSPGPYLPATTRAASPSGSVSSGNSTVIASPRSGKESTSTSSSGSATPTRITAPAQPSATIKPKSILKSSKSVPSFQNGVPITSPSSVAVPPVPKLFVPFTSPRRSPPPPPQASLPTHAQMYQRSRAASVVQDRR